jgi:hypothetical protein
MAAFLVVTASVAVLVGLVGLVAGHLHRATGRRQDRLASIPAREQGPT